MLPIVVDRDEDAPGSQDAGDLIEAGFRTRSEEVREAGVGDVDARILDGQLLGRASADVDPAKVPSPA